MTFFLAGAATFDPTDDPKNEEAIKFFERAATMPSPIHGANNLAAIFGINAEITFANAKHISRDNLSPALLRWQNRIETTGGINPQNFTGSWRFAVENAISILGKTAGCREQALLYARRWKEAEPKSMQATYVAGEIAFDSGNYSEAVAICAPMVAAGLKGGPEFVLAESIKYCEFVGPAGNVSTIDQLLVDAKVPQRYLDLLAARRRQAASPTTSPTTAPH